MKAMRMCSLMFSKYLMIVFMRAIAMHTYPSMALCHTFSSKIGIIKKYPMM